MSMPKDERFLPSRIVVILAFSGVQIIDVAGPAQVLTTANEEGAVPPYAVRVAALQAGAIQTASGFALVAEDIPAVGRIDTLVVPGGPGVHVLRDDTRMASALRDLGGRADRVCAVCTGAFLLAGAGMLDGRNAVTHWRSCERLAREYPSVTVDPEPLFLNDGPIWTTAGVTAGIDLMLSLIERDHAPALASRVARRLVVYMRRSGGQRQYSEPLALQSASAAPYETLTRAIASDPTASWTVERMAEVAGQSLRTFHRRFQTATGMSPAEAVEKVRCDLTHSLLHTTDLGLGQIAVRTGFGSEVRLRRAMVRRYGISPSDLRERFAQTMAPAREA
ncbi:AraC family transcriptional regulator [Methylobacterium hispanicum]